MAPRTFALAAVAAAVCAVRGDGSCSDTNVNCPAWAELGYCVVPSYSNAMSECLFSCDRCPGEEHTAPPRNQPPTTPPSTSPPTPAPTSACYHQVCGRSDASCASLGSCVSPTSRAAVRCCSNTDLGAGWVTNCRTLTGVWGESDVPSCFDSATWAEANDICEADGARLCTHNELNNDCTRGSGCNHDSRLVWSSTPGVAAMAQNSENTVVYTGNGNTTTSTPEPETSTPEPETTTELTVVLETSTGSGNRDSSDAGVIAGVVFGMFSLLLLVLVIVLLLRQRQQISAIKSQSAAANPAFNISESAN